MKRHDVTELVVQAKIRTGLTWNQIAEALGIGVNTVYSRLRLARAEFDQILARDRRRLR